MSEEELARAIRSNRASPASLNNRKLWIESRQGVLLVKSHRSGVTRNLRARLAILGVISVFALTAVVPFARSFSLVSWVLIALVFALLIVYPAAQLLGMSETTSFLFGLSSRIVVGTSSPSGRVLAWERPLVSITVKVSNIEEDGSVRETDPIYQLVFSDESDAVFCAFRGLPKYELERIRDRFLDWRTSETLNVS
jgi:hypothetical protein